MWWIVRCHHCESDVRVYLEESDGMPFLIPLHHLLTAGERCPGSGQSSDLATEDRAG